MRSFVLLVGVLALQFSASAQKTIITSEKAPKAIGPYSQAVEVAGFVFASGQIGLEPQTRKLVEGGIREQTRQALSNVTAVLEASGCTMSDVVSCTVYLKNIDDFTAMNDEYAKVFPANPPARATVEVSRLPMNALVEISCIAVRKSK